MYVDIVISNVFNLNKHFSFFLGSNTDHFFTVSSTNPGFSGVGCHTSMVSAI